MCMFTLHVLLIAAHRVYRPDKLFCRLHREVTNYRYIFFMRQLSFFLTHNIYFKLLVKKYIFGDSVLLYNRN